MAAQTQNKLFCSLLDADMYGRDLALLLPDLSHPNGYWLNSSCLNFGLKLLESKISKNVLRRSSSCCPLYLIDPSVMSFLRFQCDDEDLEEFNTNVKLDEREIIFCPITDTNDGLRGETQGTHWSMLVYWKQSTTFLHFDSCGRSNDSAAKKMAQVLWKSLCSRPPATGSNHDELVLNYASMAEWMPIQQNSVDCGVYAIAVVEAHMTLIEQYFTETSLKGCADDGDSKYGQSLHSKSAHESSLSESLSFSDLYSKLNTMLRDEQYLHKTLTPQAISRIRQRLHDAVIEFSTSPKLKAYRTQT